MKHATKLALLGSVLCLALAGLAAGLAGTASAANGSFFADVNSGVNADGGPVGVAVSPTQLIVSDWCTGQLYSISDAGTVTYAPPYSTIPIPGGCNEVYLAFSPGQFGWAPGVLYAVSDNVVYSVPAGGGPASTFVTLPPACNANGGSPHTGITFDTVGTFSHDMSVTCANGTVWKIDTTGNFGIGPLANTGTFIEGPAVVPQSFGVKGGQIFVGSEITGAVLAIDASGTVTTVISGLDSPEDLEVIPSSPCTFGNSGGSMFGAFTDAHGFHQVLKWPAADILSAGAGNVFVSSENAGTTQVLTVSGGGYAVGPFSSDHPGHEGADICNVVQAPNLTFTKTADAPSVNAGSPIGFTVTLSNAGPGAATGAAINDPLPGGNDVSWSKASSNDASCAIGGAPPTQTLTPRTAIPAQMPMFLFTVQFSSL